MSHHWVVRITYFTLLRASDSKLTAITHNYKEITAMTVQIWHYPRCSKSRQTLALLHERGIDLNSRLYRQDPPDADMLDDVLDRLDLQPRELMRQKEDEYTQLGLDDPDLSRDDLIAAMVDHPILIERPVVLTEHRAALGRPPQSVLALFEDA
jgi:arsenate reductase